MLVKTVKTNQALDRAMGYIVHKIAIDSTFRKQLIDDYEKTINQLPFNLAINCKPQLIEQVKQFVETQTKQQALQSIGPEAAPEGFWL